ncbi:MAG: Gldg family protein [Candidatus Brocadiia bacterium]
MNLRYWSLRAVALLNIALFLVVLAGLTHLSERHFARVDFTSHHTFTLSGGTRDLISSLQDVLHVKVYLSNDLPPEMAQSEQEIRDLFDEFAYIGGRKIALQYVDPGKDAQLKADLNQMGIIELRAQVRQKERLEYKNIFLSAAFFYRNRKEIIPNLFQEGSLELASARSIKKLVSDRTPRIAYWASNGTYDLEKDCPQLYKALIATFNITRVDVEKGEPIPDRTDLLLVISPKEKSKLSDRALYEIDQYLMSGGRAAFFLERVRLNDERSELLGNDAGIEKLIESYGITVNKDMVCDYQSMGMLAYNYGGQTLMNRCPAIVAVTKAAFAANPSQITKGLEYLYLYWPSSITVDSAKMEGHRVEKLAVSTRESTVVTTGFTLDPGQLSKPSGERKERLMGVLVAGTFDSYFKDKPAPPPPPVPSPTPGDPGSTPSGAADRPQANRTDEAYIVVVSDAFFLTDTGFRLMSGAEANLLFVQNLIEYLGLGRDLIDIRMKNAPVAKVDEIRLNNYSGMLWFFCVAFIPLWLLLTIVGVKFVSYSRKNRYERQVGR